MLRTIDLFAGAGGLSFGFEATGEYQVVAAAENNPNARRTYMANHKDDDIRMIEDVRGYDFRGLIDDIGEIDVVIGGPPCQGFSNANRQKNHIISMNNSLVKEYFRAVREIRPKAFVMENVSMLSSEKHRFYDSRIDHNEVIGLGIEMRDDEIVIADENYDGIDCFSILKGEGEVNYSISDKLLKLLNVLYRNTKSKEKDILTKYKAKNAKEIKEQIREYLTEENYNYELLHRIYEEIDGERDDYYSDLGSFVRFQKSFRLIEELKSNEIIFDLTQDSTTKKIKALVKSYSVIDYVNKILGDTYVKDSGEINSVWFGVPQERKRFIMVGVRSELLQNGIVRIPAEQDYNYIPETVGNAIFDLSEYETVIDVKEDKLIPYSESRDVSAYAAMMRKQSAGVQNHIITNTREKARKRFIALKEGQNFHDLCDEYKDNYADPQRTQNSIYLRLDANQPSETVVNVRKSMWIHPTLNRAISIREAARLQSFPDRFVFIGTKDSQYQQIGNAVPPLMAKGIAEKVLHYIANA